MRKQRVGRRLSTALVAGSLTLLVATGCAADYILYAIDIASYVAQTLAATASTVNTVTDTSAP